MKTNLLSLALCLLTTCFAWSVSASTNETKSTIIEEQGWLESAFIKWSPISEATSYKVYYKATSDGDEAFKEIDAMLIREYADYFRADVVGLKAGDYQMRVTPVFDQTEDATKAITSGVLAVKPHIREGFTFSSNSPFGTKGVGAYNLDGTLKSDAAVVYVTSATAKTVTLDVVTSDKGAITSCTGIGEILSAKEKGRDLTPIAIRIVGEVTASDMTDQLNGSGYLQVKGRSSYSELNITVEGIGDDATINGWGILVRNGGNVEVRNLGIMNFPDDGVSLDTDNTNVWVHHNDFFYGKQGSGDKAKGDGSFDVKGDSKYVTASYNHFWDSGKASLCGMTSETGENFITYHHNWFDHSDSRHPRIRTMTVHVYNNYFDGNAKYGVGSVIGANVFVENNYFRNCKYPMLIAEQGSDGGTFDDGVGGMIKAYGNTIIGATKFADQNTSATEFDAYVTSSRNEVVPETFKTKVGGYTYNNFDTDVSIMYAYSVQTAEESKDDVMQYAGRINGGDLLFTFDNAVEDKNSEIIASVRTAVNNYKGTVVSIGFGEGGSSNPEEPGEPEEPEVPEGDVTHNFTTNAKESSFFTFEGDNLSTNNGPVTYGDLTLTQGLKMNSKGKVTFTTAAKDGTLTLVFASANSGKTITIAGRDITIPSTGIVTVDLEASTAYTLVRKSGESNLFYMSVKYGDETEISANQLFGLSIYPNPVTDNLYLRSDAKIEIVEVYNMSGVLMFRAQQDVDQIDMSAYTNGSYIVKVRTSEGVTTKQIIKK